MYSIKVIMQRLKQIAFATVLKIRFGNSIVFEGKAYLNNSTEIRISKNGRISIGDKTKTYERVVFSAISNAHISIGKCCSFNRNCILVSHDEISIGDNCIIGPNVVIYDHDHKFNEYGIEHNIYTTEKVVIEEGCWIGAGVIILRGSHIGKNCIIGAGTVITGTIPSNSIVKSDRNVVIQEIRRGH